jgi:hypothetical protein
VDKKGQWEKTNKYMLNSKPFAEVILWVLTLFESEQEMLKGMFSTFLRREEQEMKPARFLPLGVLILIFAFSTLLFADVPQMINYQGKITTPTGALVDTTVQMTFTIYDDSTSGNVLWADTLGSVAVEKGIFSVLLGSGNPIPDSVFDGNVRYLGTKVGSDTEMTPRKAIVSVAYARTDGDWTISGNDLYRLDGNVGIGTDNPLTSLYVYRDTNAFVGISIENPNTESNSCEGIYFWNEDIGIAGIRLFDEGHASYPARMNIFNNRPDGSIHFGTAGQLSRMTVTNDGNIGIGTTAPDEELHVVGNIKMVDGNQAAGKVLTSDGNGVGTWQVATGTGDKDWTFHITDTADTTLMTGGEWGITRYGNTLYGNADSTHVNLGVASITGKAGYNYKYCTVGGGEDNTASDAHATVGGGRQNIASSQYATVGGGWGNTASANNSTVGGGYGNIASYLYTTVGGGYENTAGHNYATVGGGIRNKASYLYATVGGGSGNLAHGYYATVGGGSHDTTYGYCAAIPGGQLNRAKGDYSFAAGRRAKADHDGCFVWADKTEADFVSSNSDQFLIRASGGVGIGTTSPTSQVDVNGNDIRIRTSQTPASASADGYTGEIAWDSNYIYICVSGDGPGGSADSWKRAALSTW